MANEFHTLDGPCSSLVPSGPGYEGVAASNQACTVVGSQPGQTRVNGLTYIGLSFEYYYYHLWRVSEAFLVVGPSAYVNICTSELWHRLRLRCWLSVLFTHLHRIQYWTRRRRLCYTL